MTSFSPYYLRSSPEALLRYSPALEISGGYHPPKRDLLYQLIGSTGITLTPLRRCGYILVSHFMIEAESLQLVIPKHQRIMIVGIIFRNRLQVIQYPLQRDIGVPQTPN